MQGVWVRCCYAKVSAQLRANSVLAPFPLGYLGQVSEVLHQEDSGAQAPGSVPCELLWDGKSPLLNAHRPFQFSPPGHAPILDLQRPS